MSSIDIVIIIVILGGLAVGYKRGLTRSLGSVAALIISTIACRIIGANQSLPTNMLIFAVCYAIVLFAASTLHKIVNKAFLGPLDRLGGALFVAIEYVTGLSLIMNLLIWMRSMAGETLYPFGDSRWAQAVLHFMPWLIGHIKEYIQ